MTPAMQGLSDIAWGYAQLEVSLSADICQLLEGLAVEAASQLLDVRSRRKFIPQNLTNMLWGYALPDLARSIRCHLSCFAR